MKNSKINPESFLEMRKLSALENQTLKGGMSVAPSKCKKDKDCKTKGDHIKTQ
mgnify:CR=1 FL=1|tara:strand:+ start:121 stop:279 length:159 start_codon:yes stop_codon:yes gene_type:complete